MLLLEAAFVIALVAALVYWVTTLLLQSSDQRRRPAPRSGAWSVVHYDADGATHVVLQRTSDSGAVVLDEHVVATIRSDDPDYDEAFLAAMATARQRLALFESEDG